MDKNPADHFAAMFPFVEKLIEDAGVGVLRYEALQDPRYGPHDLHRQWPGLSRTTFNRFGMGVRAGKMMLDVLHGKRVPSIRLRGRWSPGDTARGPRQFPRPTH